MTLLWTARAEQQLIALQAGDCEAADYTRLVRRLVHLENDAMLFAALYSTVEVGEQSGPPAGTGPLRAHVMEADIGHVFVVLYRLSLNAEDVWIVALERGR